MTLLKLLIDHFLITIKMVGCKKWQIVILIMFKCNYDKMKDGWYIDSPKCLKKKDYMINRW